MTQPIRIKVDRTHNMSEKPPHLEMKRLLKEMFYKCIPCIKSDKKDEKLPLTPPNASGPTEYYDEE
jgi:hypothetical protein